MLLSRRIPVLALSGERNWASEWSQLDQQDSSQGISLPTLDDARFMASGASGLLRDDPSQADRAVRFLIGRLASVFTKDADAVLESLLNPRRTSFPAQRTLFVDVSDIVRMDLKTGIQRVVRRITEELLRAPPRGWRVEPVYERAGQYYLARQFTHDLLGLTLPEPNWRPDAEAKPEPGDRFLGLDWAQPMVHRARETLECWEAIGVERFFVVYDLLPLQIPQYFPRDFQDEMEVWLNDIATLGEGLLCISRTVAQEVSEWLGANNLLRGGRPWVRHFPLGADPEGVSEAPVPLPQLTVNDSSPLTLLMVGTLDGRKGYQQVLQGFEQLWRAGDDVRLVIVGRAGAQMGGLAKTLREHKAACGPAARLYWLEHVSDAQLAWLYQVCDALLCASEGEGYGLPLIEAARQGLPIISRDLPVLREVAGDGAIYFSGMKPESIKEVVLRWRSLKETGRVPAPAPPGLVSWEESAKTLWEALSRD
ncbi:glycosyltransferase family 4 protein [Marinobacter xestospongiae]|uniref:Glycosyltransferase family 1 protein n=1 Tax=Marinobacter xestospongiae TaxID=994319 RepID=A0ABU3W1N6_9GAMM|nr:glycosyltransferase family 1 protein [Marinobacter xestospongiae]MDV2079926.1 glycosyltransferase family 1 protein [Marinobacter xestospongiae]